MLSARQRLLLFSKGLAMGAADSVPGVSGGTVALITGIYEELVDSIHNIGWQALRIWKEQGMRAAWRYINGDFLITLVSGILLSLLVLARLVILLLENFRPYLMAFFAGLLLASIRFVAMNIRVWRGTEYSLLLAGAAGAGVLAFMPMGEPGSSLPMYFIYGAIGICAMILPGISGAFILVLLGAYAPVLSAVAALNLPVMFTFAAGCVFGLMAFSRLLSWLLHHHHDLIMAFLTGMLGGSLIMLWPWQLPAEHLFGEHSIIVYEHLLPGAFRAATGQDISVLACTGLLLVGAALVLLLEYVAGNLVGKDRSSRA